MLPRLTFALDLLAYLALGILLSGLLGRQLLRYLLPLDPGYQRDIAAGKASDPHALRFAWWVWAPVPFAAAWLLSGLVWR